MFTNANEHILLALGYDRTGRDNVEKSWGRGQSACSRRFIRVKPRVATLFIRTSPVSQNIQNFCTLIKLYS